ncbi:MAG: hypothetical protein HUJ30_03540 [Gammaproteobacteria bacterium]|nr:hypothetical protein [Gammaproteobacteria bacterium]
MEMQVTLSRQEMAYVSDEEINRIIEKTIRDKFNLPARAYVDKNGMLMKIEEHHGGCHSWDDKEPVRTASEKDKAALLVLKELSA